MRESQKILLVAVAMLVIPTSIAVYPYVNAYVHLNEAYAAWDAGILVVCYLERNDNQWPKSWDELTSTVQPNDTCIYFPGAPDPGDRANGYPKRLLEIKRYVGIDWEFDYTKDLKKKPFTRPNGGKLFTLWGDPNGAVIQFLRDGQRENFEMF